MTYSIDELLIRNNRGGNLAVCWLAATKKKFIGSGSSHLTKREVLNVNISAVCDDISKGLSSKEGNPRSNFYTSSQLTFGALKLFQTQLDDLEDEVKKLYTEVLGPKTEEKNKNKKTAKKSEDINVSIDYLPELQIIDLKKIFPQDKVDKNLLEEDMTFAPIQADVLPTGFGNTEDCMAEDLAAGNNEMDVNATSNLPESTTETPSKRKSRKAHDETPTKRKKTSTLSKSIRGDTPSSPQARRPLFGSSDIPQILEPTDIQQNEATAALAGINDITDITNLQFNGVAYDPVITHETIDMDVLQSMEQMAAQRQPSLTEGQNNLHNEDQLPVSSDPYQLPDLDEISLNSTSHQKKKQKKIIVFDECIQIKITEPNSVKEHTMNFKHIKVPNRVPANLLLCTPSTVLGRGLRSYNNNVCSWSLSLQNRYTEMIKTPCTDVSIGDFQREKSSRQLDLETDLLKSDSNLMPPPPASVAGLHEEFIEHGNEELQSPQMRHLKDRVIPELIPCDSAAAASPRQERLSQCMMKEASVAPDSVVETEAQDNESPMAKKEFFKFLERASQEFENNKILLDEILRPEEISAMMLLVYLHYIFKYESKGKLQIEQDIAYGKIYLIIEEQQKKRNE